MIALVHGYGLTGSGSNLWTRSVARALAENGADFHLVSPSKDYEDLDFVAEAYRYGAGGDPETLFRRDTPYPGRCVAHRPELEVLPTYVRPSAHSARVRAVLDLTAAEVEDYLTRNARVLRHLVEAHGVRAFHVNHVVLLSVAVARVAERTGAGFAVMPHGSAIEYVVKKDDRMRHLACAALARADRIFVLNREMPGRLLEVCPSLEGSLEERMVTVRAGVFTADFTPVSREDRPESIARLEAALPGPDAELSAALGRVRWSDPVVLYVGRLIAAKGTPSVVAAFPLVLGRQPDAWLVLAGDGPARPVLERYVSALDAGDREGALELLRAGGEMEGTEARWDAPRLFLEELLGRGEDAREYFAAAEGRIAERVVFTGYLGHEALRHLYPCADVAVFPSVVKEASPLVVPEAAASGAVPVGTDFAGMGETIGIFARSLPEPVGSLMRVRPDPEHTVRDIGASVTGLLEGGIPDGTREALRRVAEETFDWHGIAARVREALEELGAASGAA